MKIMNATGGTVGLAKGIIDDTCLAMYNLRATEKIGLKCQDQGVQVGE